ncbi:NAD binding domain of 6-phosphogluconate dehydrogenase family protein, partial [Vibrio parahaemolyticus V-223/04]
INSSTL